MKACTCNLLISTWSFFGFSYRKRKSNVQNFPSKIPRKVLGLSIDNNRNICNNQSNKKTSIQPYQNIIQPKCHRSSNPSADNFLSQLIENAEKSSIIIALNKISYDMKGCCKNVYTNILECKNIIKSAEETYVDKYKWKKERQFRITGSRWIILICIKSS